VPGGPVGQNDRGPAPVGVLESLDRRAGGGETIGRHRVGGRPQHRRQRGLVSGTDLHQFGDGTQNTCATAVFHKPGGAVLALQSDRERVDTGPQRGNLTFSGALGGLQFGYPFVGQPKIGHRAVVVLVEAQLTLVEFTDLGLDGLELGSGHLDTGGGLIDTGGQPRHAVVDGFHPGPAGLDLAGQPCQAFPAVGLGPDGGQVGLLGLSCRNLPLRQFGAGELETALGLLKLEDQSLLLLGDLIGLAVQFVGIRPGAGGRFSIQVLSPLIGDAHRRADPLGKRRKPEPGLAGGVGALGQRVHGGLVGAERRGGLGQPGGGLIVFATQRGLDIVGTGELRAPDHQVIGCQPQSGVPKVGLDGRRAPGDLGLAPERLELATQLGGQIGEPGQIRRGRVQFSQRLLLALAMFEHTGGLLDEGASVLRAGLEDLGEPTLTDDDVHLPADAGVAEQFLDVEQPAAIAVDLVLAGAVTIHPAGYRHLGILDRQGLVGVVDGQGDLGAAQRCPRRGAGEDDVLHFAAAQRLGALFAHHPGERVDDIGFTRPVGTHHAGDTRLETQSRRRGEGLEALERQTLEVHDRSAYRRADQRSGNPAAPVTP